MKTKIIEKKENRIRVEIHGADHAVMNLLKKKISENKENEFVTYSKPHPLLEGFVLTVVGKDPEGEIKKALEELKRESKILKESLKKAQ